MVRAFLLILLVLWGAGAYAEEAAAQNGLAGDVYVLTVDAQILKGVLEPFEEGFFRLRMADRVMKISPQMLLGIFATEKDAGRGLETIRQLVAAELPEKTGGAQTSGALADRSTRQLIRKARENMLQILRTQQPRKEIEKIIASLKVNLVNPKKLLEEKTVVNLYTLSLVKMPQKEREKFLNSLEKIQKRIDSLDATDNEKKQMHQVLEQALRLLERPAKGGGLRGAGRE